VPTIKSYVHIKAITFRPSFIMHWRSTAAAAHTKSRATARKNSVALLTD